MRRTPLPNWPRVQRATSAAIYAGYATERAFLKAVAEGEMPPPFSIGGADAWDTPDLDASIDAMKAGAQRPRKWQDGAPSRV